MADTLIAALGLAVAIVGIFIGWIASRRAELRRDQVLGWVNEVIDCLQTIVLVVRPETLSLRDAERGARLEGLAIRASVLLEQGRMFFRNQHFGTFGAEKEYSYRGIRPVILDQVLVAHQLALAWAGLAEAERAPGFDIAVQCLKRFVTLAQQEVGRDHSASIYAAIGGDGASFRVLLDDYVATGTLAPSLDFEGRGATQTLRTRWTRMRARKASRDARRAAAAPRR